MAKLPNKTATTKPPNDATDKDKAQNEGAEEGKDKTTEPTNDAKNGDTPKTTPEGTASASDDTPVNEDDAEFQIAHEAANKAIKRKREAIDTYERIARLSGVTEKAIAAHREKLKLMGAKPCGNCGK